MSNLVERYLIAGKDERKVTTDSNARYFGAILTDDMLVPSGNPRLGKIDFENWFADQYKPV